MPTFYDKLLQVPILNLSVKGIDHVVRSGVLRWFDPLRLVTALTPRLRHLAYISVWAMAFTTMSTAGGVGDDHPGQWLPFWQQACADGRSYACPYLADRELGYCGEGSGWACNEAGILHVALSQSGEDLRRLDPSGAAEPFGRGCELGFAAACRNLDALSGTGGELVRSAPTFDDYPIVLRGSKGQVREESRTALYALACRQGWPDTCGG
jgi:hypothetical protein